MAVLRFRGHSELISFPQTYGFQHILTLNNLEKAGLLKLQMATRNNYPTIRKTLKLWMEDANEQVAFPSKLAVTC